MKRVSSLLCNNLFVETAACLSTAGRFDRVSFCEFCFFSICDYKSSADHRDDIHSAVSAHGEDLFVELQPFLVASI